MMIILVFSSQEYNIVFHTRKAINAFLINEFLINGLFVSVNLFHLWRQIKVTTTANSNELYYLKKVALRLVITRNNLISFNVVSENYAYVKIPDVMIIFN